MFEFIDRARSRAVLAATMLALMTACGGGGGSTRLEAIEVTPAASSTPAGTTVPFVATALYSDDSRQDVTATATWTSGSTSVATISDAAADKGLAQTLTPGTTAISASFEGKVGTTTLTVTNAVIRSLAISPTTATIAKGTTRAFSALATFTDNRVFDVTADATWSSQNAAVATVSDARPDKGLATGVGVGTARLLAAYEGVTGQADLTVSAAAVTGLAVTPADLSKPKGTTQQYTATASFSDSTTQDVTADANWSSSATAVASVSNEAASKGQAIAVAEGAAEIGADYRGFAAKTGLTVTPAVLQSIQITPSASSVAKGLVQAYVATGVYTDGSTVDLTSTVTWSSSSSAVADISNASGSNGKATTNTVGVTTISAIDPATQIVSNSATLTVTTEALTRIEITPATLNLPKGNTQSFTATGFYTDNSRQDLTKSATWAVADAAIADVSNSASTRGLVAAKASGSTLVTASFEGQSGSATLTVTDAVLSSIQVTPASARLASGFTRQYTATGVFSDNSTRDLTTSVTWSSTATAFATVSNAADSQGLVNGVSAGTTNIVATSGSISGSTPLTVTAATLSSISVTPTNPTIPLGTSTQLTAIGTFSDNSTQDLSTQASWSSSATGVATVSNAKGTQGKVTSQSTGNATITAALKGVDGATRVTVSAATLTKLTVTPNPASVAKGRTLQMTATGTYSDNTTADITADATWSSSDTTIATVTNDGGVFSSTVAGQVSGVKEGSATVSAVLGSVTGSAPLTVTSAVLNSIAVTPATRSVAQGVSVQYTAIGTYSDSTTADITKSVTWASDASAVATISNATGSNGLASTSAVGTARITAQSAGVTSPAATLTVTAKTLSSITVTPATPTIPSGTTQQFTATARYSDNSTADLTASVTWASSSTSVADVSNASGTKGLATSKSAGQTTISATSGTGNTAVSGSTVLTVSSAALQRINLSPLNASVALGYTLQYRAVGEYADGSSKDLTAEVSWTVFNDAVANISNASGTKGLLSPVSVGNTTVRATLGSVESVTGVTVTNATLRSVDVTPKNASFGAGDTLQFKAVGTFSDSSTLDLTRQVSWASSNTNAATIDQAGLATAGGSALTSTTISATRGTGVNAVSGSTTLSRGF